MPEHNNIHMVERRKYHGTPMPHRFYSRILVFLCVLFAGNAVALSLLGGGDDDDELLSPEQAFQTSVSVSDGRLRISQEIADGYFVYKNKYKVQSDDAFVGSLTMPEGIVKQDQFFGEVETYRHNVAFDAEISGKTSASAVSVKVVSQGCADAGICYPPMTEEFVVEIPASVPPAQDNLAPLNPLPKPFSMAEPVMNDPVLMESLGSNSSLPVTTDGPSSPILNSEFTNIGSAENGSLFDSMRLDDNTAEVLDPELAFTVLVDEVTDGKLPIRWQIAEGHYLYDPKFNFQILQPADIGIATVDLTEGKLKTDEFFGEVEVHRGEARALLSFNNLRSASNVTLKVGYQGCADIGVCYPPQYKEISVTEIPASMTAASVSSANAGASSGGSTGNAINTGAPMAEQDKLAASLGSGKTITTILTFFGLGLLLTFTPCVLPMIPILSSIIVGKGDQVGTGKAFRLSLVYVLAMALTYTIAGVIIGLTGENIQAALQHPYVLAAFALLFVVLSASMFGLYELQMPSFIQNRLMAVSNQQKSGSYAGVAGMGFLSALIVGPCVTAPLVGALIYIGQTGDAVLGGAALFALSMGMGLPLLIIGTSFGRYMPKAGPWMDNIKAAFGFMLLGLAIWMLDRVIPSWATMFLAAMLLIMVGMFLGVFDGRAGSGLQKIGKGLGYASVVYGTLLLIGVGTGTGSLIRPLQGLTAGTHGGENSAQAFQHVTFNRIKGVSELEAALSTARSQNQPVILDFYADWCVSCKEMEAFTFTNQQVAAKMNQAVLLQADVTANDKADKSLLKRYGIFGPPAIIFYDNEGAEVESSRVVGFMSAEKFLTHLDRVL